jgi:hypothetical protein
MVPTLLMVAVAVALLAILSLRVEARADDEGRQQAARRARDAEMSSQLMIGGDALKSLTENPSGSNFERDSDDAQRHFDLDSTFTDASKRGRDASS